MMSPWLSIVLLGAAVFGFAWMMPRRTVADGSDGGGDAAYERLLEDLETENRELVDAVANFKQEQDDTVADLVKQIKALERQMKAFAEQAETAAHANLSAPHAASAAIEPAGNAVPETVEKAVGGEPAQPQPDETAYAPTSIRMRYAELLALHAKGRSVEQIAKSVGMNKGEVQLILQLARREDSQLA